MIWLSGGIEPQAESAAGDRDHQGGKKAKQRSLAGAVWSQQSEQLGWTHVKRNAIQSAAIPVAMHEILNRDYGRGGDSYLGVGASNGVCGHIGNHRLFYDETVLSIIRANKRGK